MNSEVSAVDSSFLSSEHVVLFTIDMEAILCSMQGAEASTSASSSPIIVTAVATTVSEASVAVSSWLPATAEAAPAATPAAEDLLEDVEMDSVTAEAEDAERYIAMNSFDLNLLCEETNQSSSSDEEPYLVPPPFASSPAPSPVPSVVFAGGAASAVAVAVVIAADVALPPTTISDQTEEAEEVSPFVLMLQESKTLNLRHRNDITALHMTLQAKKNVLETKLRLDSKNLDLRIEKALVHQAELVS